MTIIVYFVAVSNFFEKISQKVVFFQQKHSEILFMP